MDSAWCGGLDDTSHTEDNLSDTSFTTIIASEFPAYQEVVIAEEVIQNTCEEETDIIDFQSAENLPLNDSQILTCLQAMKTYNISVDSDADLNFRNVYQNVDVQDTESSCTLTSTGDIKTSLEILSLNNNNNKPNIIERPSVIIVKDSTQNNQISTSPGNQISPISAPEEMSDSKNLAAEENASEDLEDLLSVPVSKDYVNCVWTSEEPSQRHETDLESSPEKLVIADVTPPIQQSDEVTPNIHASEPAGATSDQMSNNECSSPQIFKNKKKKKKKTSKSKGNDKESVKKNPLKAKDKLSVEAKKKACDLKVDSMSPSKISSEPNTPVALSGGASREDGEKRIFCRVKRKRSVNSRSPKISTNSKNEKDTIAASDESLFAAYKNLVVHRSLPPYAPKLIDSRFFSGNYFTCKACNDRYIMQTSLTGHLSRKTANFMYNCSSCEAQVSFDNRCSLLTHIMSHDMDVDAIKPGDLVVLPFGAEGSECDTLFKNASDSFKCPECSSLVSSLKFHLNGQDLLDSKAEHSNVCNVNSSLNCKECAYILPTKCAFTAHERFHKGNPPYLCPECGESFLKSSTLLSHMNKDCFHDHKRTIFQCGYCQVVVVSIDLFTEHLISKHLRPVYVCHICGVSVGAFEDFNAHRVSQHKLAEVDPLSGTAALCGQVECDKCPGIKISLASLQDHAVSHTLDPKFMTTIYQCKDCKCMYASKVLMLNHKNVCQGKTEVVIDSLNEISFSELPADIMCSFQPSGPSEVAHAEQALPGPSPSSGLGSPRTTEDSTIQCENLPPAKVQDQEHVESTTSTMPLQSQENNVSKKDSSKMILLKKNVVCKLCRKVVSEGMDNVALKKHFSGHHFDIFMKAVHGHGTEKLPMQIVYTKSKQLVNEKERKIIQDIVNSEPKSENDDTSETDSNSKVVVIKRKLEGKSWRSWRSLKIVGQRLLVPKVDGYKCYKCLFVSGNAEAFKTHIVSHKSNPSDLQCPQCGMCFIVRPPLEKHLIVQHGVKNVGNYLRDHGFEEHISDDEGQMVDVEESDNEELQENQCKVCKEKFESALLLEKHFRVHGGAFLLANLKAKRSSQSV